MQPLCEETKLLLAPAEISSKDNLDVRLSKEKDAFHVEAFALHPHINENRHTPSGFAVNWFNRFPEKRSLTAATSQRVYYRIPATDVSAAVIDTWPKPQMKLSHEALLLYQYLTAQTVAYEKAAETVARYKAAKSLPANNLVLAPGYELSPYQIVGAFNASICEGYALFMEQGTGKTGVAITTLCNAARFRRDKTKPYLALIVPPNSVRINWKNEIANFGTGKGKATLIKGDSLKRFELWAKACTPFNEDGERCEWSFMICGYDVLMQCFPFFGKTEWDAVVLDESQLIKNPKTNRAEMAFELRDRAKKRILLTGTPIGNGLQDLWTQLEFLGKGMSGFETYKAFKKFYNVYETGADGQEFFAGNQNVPFLKERLTRVSYRVTKKEAMPELPDKLYLEIEAEMSTQQERVYQDIATKLYYEIEEDLRKDGTNQSLTITNSLTKLLRLAQITSGYVTYDPVLDPESGEILQPGSTQAFNPNPKMELVIDELKRISKTIESKAIVWTNWVFNIKEFSRRLTEEGIGHVTYYGGTNDQAKEEAKRKFNCDPYTKVFIGNPASGGAGLNLWGYDPERADLYDSNCDHVFYYSQNWSNLERQQSEDRAHRRNTRVPVNIIDVVIGGTIDEEIRCRVMEKQKLSLEASDIRNMLKAILVGVGA